MYGNFAPFRIEEEEIQELRIQAFTGFNIQIKSSR